MERQGILAGLRSCVGVTNEHRPVGRQRSGPVAVGDNAEDGIAAAAGVALHLERQGPHRAAKDPGLNRAIGGELAFESVAATGHPMPSGELAAGSGSDRNKTSALRRYAVCLVGEQTIESALVGQN